MSKKDHADKIRWIYTQATETRNAFRNTAILNQNNASYSTINITWKQPPDGWYVLNTDGSFGNGAANGSCAGVVRDSRGSWCGDFGFKVPATTVAMKEVWAILKGVEWAWRKGLRKLIVQSDSKKSLIGLKTRTSLEDPCATSLRDASNTMWAEWEEPPHCVNEALLFDLSAFPCERVISEECNLKRTGSEEMELEDEVRGGGGRGCDKRKMKWSRRTRLEKAEVDGTGRRNCMS
nr:heat shock 70 kDa protein-like [Ipomoea batatas]